MNNITIIEDEDILRENLETLLTVEGYNVDSFEDGKSAISFLKTNSPDLILCDVMLPDLDGYEIVKSVKNSNSKKHIPFVFLTAKTEMSDLREGMNLGADDYLLKPYKASELLGVIKKRIELSKKESQKEETEIDTKDFDLEDQFFAKTNKGIKAVQIKNIVCIIAQAPYSEVYLQDKSKVIVRKLIKEWENSLPHKTFIRVHKSTMININYISKVEKWFNNSYKIDLNNFEESIYSSRRYSTKLRAKFIT